jgi:hypothetical protein
VAQARDPLTPVGDHDSFVLIAATTTSSDTVMIFQNTVTGDSIEAPRPELPKPSLLRRYKV